MVNHPNRKKDPRQGLRHLRMFGGPPKTLPKDRVLVHNQVLPQYSLGLNGFRAWTQILDDNLIVCPCKWAGRNLYGHTHYRMAFANPWAWEDEALAERIRGLMFARMRGDESAEATMETIMKEWEDSHPSA
jgi:hypothetical protein